jgi:WD40 repeat protein/serine/threonine protein kinase
MIRETESIEPSVEPGCATYEVLLDQLAEVLRQGGVDQLNSFLHDHPTEAPQLRKMIPTLRAMAEIAAPDDSPTTASAPEAGERLPGGRQTLGDFRIVRELGRGGMGVVYLAEQISLHRQVALKILPLAAVMDPRQLQRFKNEVQAVALLQHQNIVPVYSVGSERGIHYYAMQYVEGPTVAQIVAQLRHLAGIDGENCDPTDVGSKLRTINEALTRDFLPMPDSLHCPSETSQAGHQAKSPGDTPAVETEPHAALSTLISERSQTGRCRQIVRLIIQAAEALDHAHRRGVVHRDIKPGNLMIDAQGNLWVTDFGLARLETDAGLTMTGDIVGTLRYMSPEQALAKRVVVDHRTDIYSLGATLYELLTLQPAYQGRDREELLRQIAFEEPRGLRKINPAIPTELDTITRKAIEKNPADRYETAEEMAADLRRYLEDRPILARPPSWSNRLRKWTTRHVGMAWTLALASLALALLLGVSAAAISASRDQAEQQRQQAQQQRTAAVQQRNAARRHLYRAEMAVGQSNVDNQNPGGLYAHLVRHLPVAEETDHRDWEWYYLMSRCQTEVRTLRYPRYTPFAAWSPDGQYLGGPGAIWQADTGARLRRFNTSWIAGYRVAWSPDGQQFAWGMAADESAFYIWDRAADSVSRFAGHESSVWCVAFSPDGAQIASGSIDKTIKIWDVATQTVLWTADVGRNVSSLAWSRDGKLLAAGLNLKGIQVWDVSRQDVLFERSGDWGDYAVAWHPQGNVLAVCEGESWYLLNREDWSVMHQQEISRGGGAIAYSPDGSQIAVGHGETATVWDSAGEVKLAELKGHRYPVCSVSWGPAGRRLVTADNAQEIKLWDLDQHDQPPPIDAGSELQSLAWLPDNQTLVTVSRGESGSAWWNAPAGSLERRETSVIKPPSQWSPDRQLAAVHLPAEHALSILETSTGATRAVLKLDSDRRFHSCAFSGDGSRLVTQSELDKRILLEFWDVDQERRTGTWSTERAYASGSTFGRFVWAAEGTRVAAAGTGDVGDDGSQYWRSHVHVFDAAAGERVGKYAPTGDGAIESVAWSADGRLIAAGTSEGRVEVVDWSSRRRQFSEKFSQRGIGALAWHPDGNRLAYGDDDGKVGLLASDDGYVLSTFSVLQEPVTQLTWSDNGQRLAGAARSGQIRVWDASRGYALAAVDGPRRGELAWAYYDRATRSSDKDFQAALRQFVSHAPDTLDFWEARGAALAQLGEFKQAFDEFSKGIEPDVQYAFEAARDRALTLLGAEEVDRYCEACAQLVEAFKNSPVPSNRGDVAWLCVLAPNRLVDSRQVFKMASFSHEDPDNEGVDQQVLTLGGALYRDGQFDEAAQVLTKLAAKLERGGDAQDLYELACTKYFLSLVRQEMGHAFQSRRLLDEANRTAAACPPSRSLWNWSQSVVLDTLRQETEQRLGKSVPANGRGRE